MEAFTIRDLRERTGELVRNAERGALAVVAKHGHPLFVAVPLDDCLLRHGVLQSVGESAAIRLARAAAVPVLMDDRAGRSVARNQRPVGVAVIGSDGVVLAAKQRGLIDAVAPLLQAFQANGYHLSTALVQAILDRAGEAPERP